MTQDEQKTKAELLRELNALLRRVSELKQVEEELKHPEKKFKELIENTFVGVYRTTPEGRVTMANPALVRMLGYSSFEELSQRNLEKERFAPKYPRSIFKDLIEREGKLVGLESTWRKRDGTSLSITENAWVVRGESGKTLYYEGIVQDLAERKKAQEGLIELEEKYREIVELAPDGIVTVDLKGIITSCNSALLQHTGYTKEDFVGKHISKVPTARLKDIPKYLKIFSSLLMGKAPKPFEFMWVHKDGSKRWGEASVSIMRRAGKITGFQAITKDITERKRAEEKFENLAKFPSENPNPVLRISKDCTILYANDASSPVLETWERKVSERLPNDCCKRIKEVFNSTGISSFEFKCNNGRIFSVTLAPIVDAGYANAYGLDITERKKAEEALRESEEEYRKLFEETTDAIFVADAETGTLIDCNSAAAELVGREKSELVGKHRRILHPPEEIEGEFSRTFKQHMKEKEGQVLEAQVVTKKGQIKDVEIRASCLELQGKKCVQGMFRDITERKKAEEQIRKLNFAIEQSIDGIAIDDFEPKLLYVNNAFARMHGYTSEDMIGMPVVKLYNKKRMGEYKRIEDLLTTKGSWEGEIEHIRKDGTAFPAYIGITILKNNEGKTIGKVAVVRDITETKRREKQLNIYREKMVQAEHLASVGTLSATLAHELTQPLTVISLSIENSLAELEKTSCPDTVVEDLKEGLSEVSSITSMVNRFRNFARRSSEEIKVAKVDLKAIAERTVKLLDENAWRAKVTLRIEGMNKLPHIYSCERELEQLFFSLIENAIQAADGKYTRQVIISGAERGEHIELRFSDNCGGIAPGNLKKIFQPFFTTKPSTERTGLGLCVVERILSRLDGKVRVESEFGKGSIFFVTLPINKDEE